MTSVLLALLLAAPTTEAQRLAQQSFAEAEAAFARREFAAAAAAFEQAARAVPHPAPWLNAAEAWEMAGAPERAMADCEQAGAAPSGTAVHAEAARRCMDRLRLGLGQVALLGSAEGEARIDARRFEFPAKVWLRPGRYTLEFTARGTEQWTTEMIEVVAGQSLERRWSPARPPPPPLTFTSTGAPPAEVPSSPGPGVATWAAFGVAGAAVVGTVVLGSLTVAAKSDFEAMPTRDGADAFYDRRLGTNVALTVAVSAVAAGVLFWVLEL